MNQLECTTCKICGRKLKNPVAIQRGMGKVCWEKYIKEKYHKKLFNKGEKEGKEE